jgi:two-component system, cell cycle sensor histidine kinase and response regulator CckA
VTRASLESKAYQAELESQNQALRYAQLAAEGASERFSALFSSVPLALMVIDETGQVLESNARALASFRPQERDPALAFLLPLVGSEFSDQVTQAIQTAKQSGQCAVQGIDLRSGDSATLTGDLHIARIDNRHDELANFICAFVDQGPLLAQQRALRESAAQLRESQKMQAIGTMASGIAHDFNNILATILGNVELARQDAGVDSPTQTSLIEIEKAGRRARDLVRQILTFSRREPPQRTRLHLADIVQEVARLIRLDLPPNTALQIQIDPNTPPVLAEATQVQQALINLCTNASYAIGSTGGTICIELGSVLPGSTHNPAFQDISQERRSAPRSLQVALAVRDTGAGMDADLVQRVFEPFFTTKPTGQGTGLGLAVVHGVMRAHDGFAHVRSTPSAGSVFTLHFPAATWDATLQADQSSQSLISPNLSPKKATAGQGGHVMYVDDDTALVFLVERALKRCGFKVTSFTQPALALNALRAQPHDFDLMVTDYNMPDLNGIDLLRQALVIRADLPVALASGYVTREIEQSALAAGAKALIHKPNDVGELVDTVQRLLRGTKTDGSAD